MEPQPLFHIKVLQVLVGRYGKNFTLEDLTERLSPYLIVSTTLINKVCIEKENYARVLEALILLDDDGLVSLNSNTDQSSITIKGLLKVNYKVLSN